MCIADADAASAEADSHARLRDLHPVAMSVYVNKAGYRSNVPRNTYGPISVPFRTAL